MKQGFKAGAAAFLGAALMVSPAAAECVPGQVSDGWLLEQEKQGGTTMDRHVGKADASLMDHLKRDLNVPFVSTFPDRHTARAVIGMALAMDKTDLDDWATVANPGEVAEIRMSFEQPIGRLMRRGTAVGEPAFGLRMYVRATGGGKCYLMVAYPTRGAQGG